MAAPTVNVTCTAHDQNGNPVAGALFVARLDRTEIYDGFVVPEQFTGVANADGVCVLQLWPNALGVASSQYKISAVNPDDGRRFLNSLATIPNNDCFLHEVMTLEPYPPINAAQQALVAAQNALAPVQEAAAEALGYRDDALNSANTAVAAASAASASADSAAASELAAQAAADAIDGFIADVAAPTGSALVGFQQPGGVARTAEDELRIASVILEQFGGVGDGVANDTAAYNAARALGRGVRLLAGKTYLVDGWVLQSGDSIIGDPANRPTIKLKNAGNAHVIYGNNVTDIVLRDFIVDGNKSNQSIGAGNNWRGVYLLGACHRIQAQNLSIRQAVDHGFFMSDGGVLANRCGKDSLISAVEAKDCGSAAHLAAGGAGGSGMVGGDESTTWLSCYGTGNHLNGMKSAGVHTSCHSYNNAGGFETGFDSPEKVQTKYTACSAKNNTGDGWRNLGQVDELTWVDCVAEGNGQSGIAIVNNVNRATIIGGSLKNNGQDTATPYGDTVGFAGLFVSATSGTPSNITVKGVQFFDDQTTKTQRHHIYIGKTVESMAVDNACQFGDALIQKTFVASIASASTISFGRCFGLDANQRDFAPATVTGTTSVTNFKSVTIPARTLAPYNSLRVFAKGTATGTNGTKIVRLVVGSLTLIVANETAAEQQNWAVEAEIYRNNGTLITLLYRAYEVGGAVSTGVLQGTLSGASDLVISTSGALGSALDTVTQQVFIVEPN